MVSKTLGYSKNYNNANPGDIVMVSARDVDHLAVKYGLFSFNYLLCGVVIDYIYIDWETGRVDKEWDGVVRNHEGLRVKWVKIARRKYEDWDIVPPSTKWVKVMGKRKNGELSGMDPFLKAQLMTDFFLYSTGVISIHTCITIPIVSLVESFKFNT